MGGACAIEIKCRYGTSADREVDRRVKPMSSEDGEWLFSLFVFGDHLNLLGQDDYRADAVSWNDFSKRGTSPAPDLTSRGADPLMHGLDSVEIKADVETRVGRNSSTT